MKALIIYLILIIIAMYFAVYVWESLKKNLSINPVNYNNIDNF
jgi:hypothetical protein